MARKIALKTERIGDSDFIYIEQLIGITSAGPGGAPIDAKEMFEALPIVEKLKAHKTAQYVILEDAEWRFIRDRVEAGKYPALHDVWIGFITAVREAETVKLEEVREEAG